MKIIKNEDCISNSKELSLQTNELMYNSVRLFLMNGNTHTIYYHLSGYSCGSYIRYKRHL